MVQIGDTVRFLNDVGGGVVTRISGNMAYVQDNDGFETPVLTRECVVVTVPKSAQTSQTTGKNHAYGSNSTAYPGAGSAKSSGSIGNSPTNTTIPAEGRSNAAQSEQSLTAADIAETEYGDQINLVLGFEAKDIKRLSDTEYICSLVNDSNYYIQFVIATQNDTDEHDKWQTFYAGVIEPNIQLHIKDLSRFDVARIDKMAFHYTAYKLNKTYTLKNAETVILNLDNTKFFKFHCFRTNGYFDGPVLAFNIVLNDHSLPKPVRIDSNQLAEQIKTKQRNDAVVKHNVSKKARKNMLGKPLVIDLHIHELVDTTAGLSNADMLNLQIDTFRNTMDENIKQYGQKIIFIHGKGDGVLRNAISKELNHRYKGHDVQDASFAEYGYGATQVTIRQLRK